MSCFNMSPKQSTAFEKISLRQPQSQSLGCQLSAKLWNPAHVILIGLTGVRNRRHDHWGLPFQSTPELITDVKQSMELGLQPEAWPGMYIHKMFRQSLVGTQRKCHVKIKLCSAGSVKEQVVAVDEVTHVQRVFEKFTAKFQHVVARLCFPLSLLHQKPDPKTKVLQDNDCVTTLWICPGTRFAWFDIQKQFGEASQGRTLSFSWAPKFEVAMGSRQSVRQVLGATLCIIPCPKVTKPRQNASTNIAAHTAFKHMKEVQFEKVLWHCVVIGHLQKNWNMSLIPRPLQEKGMPPLWLKLDVLHGESLFPRQTKGTHVFRRHTPYVLITACEVRSFLLEFEITFRSQQGSEVSHTLHNDTGFKKAFHVLSHFAQMGFNNFRMWIIQVTRQAETQVPLQEGMALVVRTNILHCIHVRACLHSGWERRQPMCRHQPEVRHAGATNTIFPQTQRALDCAFHIHAPPGTLAFITKKAYGKNMAQPSSMTLKNFVRRMLKAVEFPEAFQLLTHGLPAPS